MSYCAYCMYGHLIKIKVQHWQEGHYALQMWCIKCQLLLACCASIPSFPSFHRLIQQIHMTFSFRFRFVLQSCSIILVHLFHLLLYFLVSFSFPDDFNSSRTHRSYFALSFSLEKLSSYFFTLCILLQSLFVSRWRFSDLQVMPCECLWLICASEKMPALGDGNHRHKCHSRIRTCGTCCSLFHTQSC